MDFLKSIGWIFAYGLFLLFLLITLVYKHKSKSDKLSTNENLPVLIFIFFTICTYFFISNTFQFAVIYFCEIIVFAYFFSTKHLLIFIFSGLIFYLVFFTKEYNNNAKNYWLAIYIFLIILFINILSFESYKTKLKNQTLFKMMIIPIPVILFLIYVIVTYVSNITWNTNNYSGFLAYLLPKYELSWFDFLSSVIITGSVTFIILIFDFLFHQSTRLSNLISFSHSGFARNINNDLELNRFLFKNNISYGVLINTNIASVNISVNMFKDEFTEKLFFLETPNNHSAVFIACSQNNLEDTILKAKKIFTKTSNESIVKYSVLGKDTNFPKELIKNTYI